jgi:hypothetical protein
MRRILSVFVGGLFLIGCGSDDAPAASSDGGSGSPIVDSSSSDVGEQPATSDSGSGDSGEPEAADLVPPSKSGYVGAGSYATDVVTVFANSVSAGFFDGPGYWFQQGCRREVAGACSVLLCDYADGGAATPPTGPIVSAGPITVGGTTPSFSLTYDMSTMKYGAAPAVPTDKPLYADGATVTFAAAGAEVPAFSDSLVTPTTFAITSPSLAGGTLSIDTSKDLVFTWSGAAAGNLALNIRTTTTSAGVAAAVSFVSCQFKASARTATIPTSQLQKLTKTGGNTTAIIGTDLSSTKEIVAGGYMIHLAVGGVATKVDGTPYASSQVTIF